MKEIYQPKISIITPSYNQGKYIEENILSVLNQDYQNFEHIIIDGGSTDNTVNILKRYPHLNWISEPDKGQSDAYNKALKMITGDLVLCLNTDDYLLNKNIFATVIAEINRVDITQYSTFMGNLFLCDENGNKIGEMNNKNRDYSFDDLLNKLPTVIHPATFFRRECLNKTNGFAENIHYVMDYDIFLKIAKIAPIHSIPVHVSALRRHDSSKGCSDQRWRFSWEFVKVRIRNGGSIFNKMNFQPYKNIFYKVLGVRIVDLLKNSKVFNRIAIIIGIKKLNRLTWHDNENDH